MRQVPLAEAIGLAEKALGAPIPVTPVPQHPPRDASALWAKLDAYDDAGSRYLGRRLLPTEGLVRYNVGKCGDEWLDRKARHGYRVAVPLRDASGSIRSIQLRAVVPTEQAAKLNLPGCSTSALAFGNPPVVQTSAEVHLCEGLADYLAVTLAGDDRVLGAPGADQLYHLASMVGDPKGRRFVLWPQNDAKSMTAFSALSTELKARGAEVVVARTPNGWKDPAEWQQAEPGALCAAPLSDPDPEPAPAPFATIDVEEPYSPSDMLEDQPLGNDYASLCRILRDPMMREWATGAKGSFAYNEMTLMPCFMGRPVLDHDLSAIRERCCIRFRSPQHKAGLKFTKQDIADAVQQVAHEVTFHPVRSFLEGLQWDGVERLKDACTTYINPQATEFERSALRRWFIGTVARAMRPGCQMDNVLVLVGPQGKRKSSFFRTVAGDDWFSDSSMDIGNKDSYLLLRSVWIYEWAEMEAMAKARDQGAVKAFITSREDMLRPPYGRATQRYPRSCVIVGTVNEEFLSDSTGNRRYWPVRSPDEVRLDLVERDRAQLWAEAVCAFRAGEQWYLTASEDAALPELQEQYLAHDAWEDRISGFIIGYTGHYLTTAAILEECIKKPTGQWTKADANRVGAVMRTLKWKLVRAKIAMGSRRPYVWEPCEPLPEPDPF